MTLVTKIYRFALLGILFFCGVKAQQIGLMEYLSDPFEMEYVMELVRQHLVLVGSSMLMATVIGLGAGILLTRDRMKKHTATVMYILSLGQTIPSLAVIAISLSFLGIGTKPAIFALTIYSILPIARNTLAGIQAVPPGITDAARGIGLTPFQILLAVELPNAASVILTGFRIALVINVGSAPLGFLVGAGGLGDLIFTGIDMMMPVKLLAGAIPTTLLALVGDYACELLGRMVIPKGLRLQNS
ncbi:ABC transporter permease [Desulfoluna spongiiphila]|uniref:Osmoprotectant transport system permease protein n=1 Tax=Desulfoluna spongiiphila TaxID=419481 RepID=A0A1G5ERM3_9BACT|nr:ABC transporter permease [Desulfoluna spongiiphila]SCY29088.1 osmoprotectant transport system permease protein [Desulfoluna spongiiphila]VVS91270.1 abc transporter type 1 transmembrane domain meti-like [Desulfoluna spongiiphila]